MTTHRRPRHHRPSPRVLLGSTPAERRNRLTADLLRIYAMR